MNLFAPVRDPETERRIRLIGLFLESWKELHSLLAYSLSADKGGLTLAQERRFTDLRSYLLEEHEHVFHQLGLDKEHYQLTKNVLASAPALHLARQFGTAQAAAVNKDWNDVFTSLELLLGQLKLRKSELAKKWVLSVTFNKLVRNRAFWVVTGLVLVSLAAICLILHFHR